MNGNENTIAYFKMSNHPYKILKVKRSIFKSRDETNASDPEIAGRIHPDKSPKIHPRKQKEKHFHAIPSFI